VGQLGRPCGSRTAHRSNCLPRCLQAWPCRPIDSWLTCRRLCFTGLSTSRDGESKINVLVLTRAVNRDAKLTRRCTVETRRTAGPGNAYLTAPAELVPYRRRPLAAAKHSRGYVTPDLIVRREGSDSPFQWRCSRGPGERNVRWSTALQAREYRCRTLAPCASVEGVIEMRTSSGWRGDAPQRRTQISGRPQLTAARRCWYYPSGGWTWRSLKRTESQRAPRQLSEQIVSGAECHDELAGRDRNSPKPAVSITSTASLLAHLQQAFRPTGCRPGPVDAISKALAAGSYRVQATRSPTG